MSAERPVLEANEHGREVAPDQAPAADLPVHARERLAQMKKAHFFTSDFSVSEFLLVKQVGFDPLGLVMGSSIYRIRPQPPKTLGASAAAGSIALSGEFEDMTKALYHARELAMTRMEEEAEALGADGVIGVRLEIGFHTWGKNVAEFIAVGTAVRHRGGGDFKAPSGKPFTSNLSGQDFWTLLRAGYRPVGFVMGNCVYYVDGTAMWGASSLVNQELTEYTHCLYDARELAMERLQAEAEDEQAQGIVGVKVQEVMHQWKNTMGFGYWGEMIEFFVVGTAVVAMPLTQPIPVPTIVIPVNR